MERLADTCAYDVRHTQSAEHPQSFRHRKIFKGDFCSLNLSVMLQIYKQDPAAWVKDGWNPWFKYWHGDSVHQDFYVLFLIPPGKKQPSAYGGRVKHIRMWMPAPIYSRTLPGTTTARLNSPVLGIDRSRYGNDHTEIRGHKGAPDLHWCNVDPSYLRRSDQLFWFPEQKTHWVNTYWDLMNPHTASHGLGRKHIQRLHPIFNRYDAERNREICDKTGP
jgi:hypothetical protein